MDTAPAQMPKTVLVGLPELTVRESVHRIERALVNLGYRLHMGRTVINLAPADLRKDAGAFDLPIALGMLVATGQITAGQARRLRLGRRTGPRRRRAAGGRGAVDGDGGPRRAARRASSFPPRTPAKRRSCARSRCTASTSLADAVGIVIGAGRDRTGFADDRRGRREAQPLRHRLRGREGAGVRQAGAHGRRRRRPQRPDVVDSFSCEPIWSR